MTDSLFPFQFGCFFISSSCLIAMARTSSAMLNKSGERRHPCLVPNLNAFHFCPLSTLLAKGLSYMAISWWNTFSLLPLYWEFYHKWVLDFIKNFSASIDMILWFLIFSFYVVYHIIDLWILYQPCIIGVHPTWSWCAVCLMYCWIQFADILLRILASMFIRYISL